MNRFLSILIISLLSVASWGQNAYTLKTYDDAYDPSLWHFTKVLQDRQGMIWFGTWNGIVRFDGYDFIPFKAKPGDGIGITSDRVRNIVLGEGDNIICRFDESVYTFNTRTCIFSPIASNLQKVLLDNFKKDEVIIPGQDTVCIGANTIEGVRQHLVDNQKIHWLLREKSVFKVSPRDSHGTLLSGAPQGMIRCMFQDKDGRIWISSRDSKVVAVFSSDLSLLGYLGLDGKLHPSPQSFAPVYSIFRDSRGCIWLGCKPGGIFRLTPDGSNFNVEYSDKLATDVYDFAEDSNHRLIIASQQKGLFVLENPDASKASEFKFVDILGGRSDFSPAAKRFRRILLLNNGTLLAASIDGLFVVEDIRKPYSQWDIHLHQREADREKSLSSSALMNFCYDSHGSLFVSTESGGINQLLTKDINASTFEWQSFNTSNGLGCDIIQTMMPWGDRLFIQTSKEIILFSPSDGKTENYGPNFWDHDINFSDAEPLFLSDGRILLSLEDGVLVVPQSELTQKGFSPRLVLTSLQISNEQPDYSVNRMDTVVLSSSHRSLKLKFAALDYRDNTRLLYRTRMSDKDEWGAATRSNEISLQDLSPGTYTFQVCSTNADGQWTDNIRTLTIIVEPTFFEAWYGQVILILILIVIVIGFTVAWLHIRRLKAERRQTLDAYLKLLEEHEKTISSAAKDVEKETKDIAIPAPAEVSARLSEEDEMFMQRLMAFVEGNISNSNTSVNDIAEAMAMSRSSLSRKMHQLLGITPVDFLKEARIKRACSLLMDDHSKNISDVAYACGFSDPKYFAKCFKNSVGKTPKEYRAR